MSYCTDDDCIYCSSDNTEQIAAPQICDTYGGDYSHEEVRRCRKCGKLFKCYQSDADDGRAANWDRNLDESDLLYYRNQMAKDK